MLPGMARLRPTLRRLLLALALVAAAGALALHLARRLDGPLGPIPGGAFRSGTPVGEVAPDWSFARDLREIEIEMDPASPRSVRTWFVVQDGEPVASADFLNPAKRWPYDVLRDPRVRLRLGGRIFERRALRVQDPAAIARLRAAFARKYALAPDGLAARTEVWFFRMDPP